MGEIAEGIGARIKTFRKLAGLNQAELAQQAGISEVQLSKVERGLQFPREETLLKISAALKKVPEELLSPEPHPVIRAIVGLGLREVGGEMWALTKGKQINLTIEKYKIFAEGLSLVPKEILDEIAKEYDISVAEIVLKGLDAWREEHPEVNLPSRWFWERKNFQDNFAQSLRDAVVDFAETAKAGVELKKEMKLLEKKLQELKSQIPNGKK